MWFVWWRANTASARVSRARDPRRERRRRIRRANANRNRGRSPPRSPRRATDARAPRDRPPPPPPRPTPRLRANSRAWVRPCTPSTATNRRILRRRRCARRVDPPRRERSSRAGTSTRVRERASEARRARDAWRRTSVSPLPAVPNPPKMTVCLDRRRRSRTRLRTVPAGDSRRATRRPSRRRLRTPFEPRRLTRAVAIG